MPFKVVQTIEDGEICLSVIPSGWESKGILRWPKKHLVGRLALVEASIPDEKWERFNCVCKREFKTRLEAEAEIDRMENKSDTEREDERIMPPPKKKLRPEQSSNKIEPRNFNGLISATTTHPAANLSQDVSSWQNALPSSNVFPSSNALPSPYVFASQNTVPLDNATAPQQAPPSEDAVAQNA